MKTNKFISIVLVLIITQICFAEIEIYKNARTDNLVALKKNFKATNVSDKTKTDLLLTAAMNGYLKMVEFILAEGADVNSSNSSGVTALMLASMNNRIDVVNYLISKGSKVNAETKAKANALIYAGMNQNIDVVRILIEAGADKDKIDLSYFMKFGDIETTEEIIDTVDNINYDYKGLTGLTPLVMAAYKQEYGIFDKLLDSGADVDITTKWGTAIHRLLSNEKYDMAGALLNDQTDIESLNEEGKTLLLIASSSTNLPLVRLLLEKGANVNAQDENGATPLYTAIHRGNKEMATLFLKSGADASIASIWGTPLFLAEKRQDKIFIDLLNKYTIIP